MEARCDVHAFATTAPEEQEVNREPYYSGYRNRSSSSRAKSTTRNENEIKICNKPNQCDDVCVCFDCSFLLLLCALLCDRDGECALKICERARIMEDETTLLSLAVGSVEMICLFLLLCFRINNFYHIESP